MAPEQEDNAKLSINWEELFHQFRFPVLFILIGVVLLGFGLLVTKDFGSTSKVEIIEDADKNEMDAIVVEVSGAVEKAGVYKLNNEDRIEDVLVLAGGISADADRVWMEKFLNRASKLVDGQKVYIPRVGEQSGVLSAKDGGGYQSGSSSQEGQKEEFININTANLKTLDSLPGIGPVYGQNIIEQRPYSNTEELVSKDVIPTKTYEKIKDKISVY